MRINFSLRILNLVVYLGAGNSKTLSFGSIIDKFFRLHNVSPKPSSAILNFGTVGQVLQRGLTIGRGRDAPYLAHDLAHDFFRFVS